MRSRHDVQQNGLDQRQVSFYIYLPVRYGESCCWIVVPFRAGHENSPRCVDPLDEFFVKCVIRCTEEDDHIYPAQALLFGFAEGRWNSWKEFVAGRLGNEVGNGARKVDLAVEDVYMC